MRKQLFISTVSLIALVHGTRAATFSVANEAELISAINSVNATAGTHTITFANNITLSGTNAVTLPPILNSVTINGGGYSLSGNNTTRLLMIGTDTASAGTLSAGGLPSRPAVTVNSLALNNGLAQGGSGAGGGMGAGGALFIGQTADVVISNVSFTGNRASGGVGSSTNSGGGGMGGNGISGGGGLSGNGATGGGGLLSNAVTGAGGGYGVAVLGQTGTGGTGTVGAGTNGSTGGGFGAGTAVLGKGGIGGFGGGGGASGANNVLAGGGNGGFGGGGGVGYNTASGGVGGFGGGGGGAGGLSAGGNGGFGGGGGGSTKAAAGKGGFGGGGGFGQTSLGGFGGTAGTTTTGGSGAAFGGSVFVMQGGSLTYGGESTMTSGTLAAGTGAQTAGSGIFIQGKGEIKLTPGANKTMTINDTIVDQNGMVAAGYAAPTGTFTGNEQGNLLVSGPGTVILNGTNLYSGGTWVNNAAVLSIKNNQNLGASESTLTLDNATLKAGAAYSSDRKISVGGNSTIDNSGHIITHSGVITGPGAIAFKGTGQTNITGVNTFSGGITVSHTRLGVSSDASLGALNTPIALVSGGTIVALSNVAINRTAQIGSDGLQFDSGGYISNWNGQLSGTGALAVDGTGILSLTGNNTFTGGTTVNQAATLSLGNGTTQGTLIGNVVNNGTFAVNTNGNQTLTNNVTGTGSTAINGTGTVTYLGTNTSTGAVNVNQGTLQLGNGGTTGTMSGPIAIATPATVSVNHSGPTQFTQPISGTGTLLIQGGGTTTLTGTNTFTGTTNIAADSKMSLGDGKTNGTIGGTIVNNGELVLNNPTATTVTANVSGTGGLTQTGAGTTTLTGTTTYTGATTVENGKLVVEGTLSGPVISTGTGEVIVNGQIKGGVVGGVGTTINVGSTVVGDAKSSKGNVLTINGIVTGNVDIVPNSTLVGSGTLGSLMSSGTLQPGSSPTEIGTLTVNGSMKMTGASRGEFGITPTSNDQIKVIGASMINGGLVVNAATGTYIPGTRYTLIDGQGGIKGTFLETSMTGASLGNNILHRFVYNPNSVELVLSTASLQVGLASQPSYIRDFATSVDTHAGTAGSRGAMTALYDLTADQTATAVKSMTGQSIGGGVNALGRASGQFANSVMENGVRTGFMGEGGGNSASQAMPSQAMPSQSISQAQTFGGQQAPIQAPRFSPQASNNPSDTAANRRVAELNNRLERLEQRERDEKRYFDEQRMRDQNRDYTSKQERLDRDDPYLYVASNNKSHHPNRVIWGSLVGGAGSVSANTTTGMNALSTQTYGLAGGITYRPDHNLILGAALSSVGVSSSTGGNLGSTEGQGIQGALYGRLNDGPLYIANVFSLGWSSQSTTRNAIIGASTTTFNGKTTASSLSNRTEVGYRMGKEDVRVIPFAALNFNSVNQKGFSEKDGSGAAVGNSYSDANISSLRLELGFQFEKQFRLANKQPWSAKAQIAWGHLLNSRQALSATYTPIPAISFAVPLMAPEQNVLLAGVSLEWHVKSHVQAFLGVNGEFAAASMQGQARIGLKSSF